MPARKYPKLTKGQLKIARRLLNYRLDREIAECLGVAPAVWKSAVISLGLRRTKLGRRRIQFRARPRILRPLEERFWEKVKKTDVGCWLWTGSTNNHGYGRFNIDRYPEYAHRVAWTLIKGTPPGADVDLCPTCNNPPCVNPSHMYEGDALTNARDAVVAGRHNPKRGEANCWAKLNEAAVRDIRSSYSGRHGELTSLARKYGVGATTVSSVVRRTAWKHVA